jgi:hypothetical protein
MREHTRLMPAVNNGERRTGLLEALRALDRRRQALESERSTIATPLGISARDGVRVREELLTLAASWRTVVADDPTHLRPIVTSLLNGRRVTITPLEGKRWQMRGEGTIAGLFSKVFPLGMASPTETDRCCGPAFRRILKAA